MTPLIASRMLPVASTSKPVTQSPGEGQRRSLDAAACILLIGALCVCIAGRKDVQLCVLFIPTKVPVLDDGYRACRHCTSARQPERSAVIAKTVAQLNYMSTCNITCNTQGHCFGGSDARRSMSAVDGLTLDAGCGSRKTPNTP